MKTQTNQSGEMDENNKAKSSIDDAIEADGTPVLDEQDLAENQLTADEAENIIWDDKDALEADAAMKDDTDEDVDDDADFDKDEDDEDEDWDEEDEKENQSRAM